MTGSCNGNWVQPALNGDPGKVLKGIEALGSTNNYNTFEVTLMRSTLLPSAAAKLTVNGVAITTAGQFSLNYASGNFL